jgi:hypothetical protein
MSAKRRMPDSPKRIGDAADHGRSESKEYLAGMLRKARYETGNLDGSEPEEDDADSAMPSRSQRDGSGRDYPRF